MKLNILNARGGGYFVRIVASNGQTLAHSEVYTAKHNAKNCAEVIKASASGATIADLTA